MNVEYEDVHFPPLGLRSLSRPAICSCDHWHYWFFIFLVIVQCVSNAWVMLLYISSLWAPLFVFRQCIPPIAMSCLPRLFLAQTRALRLRTSSIREILILQPFFSPLLNPTHTHKHSAISPLFLSLHTKSAINSFAVSHNIRTPARPKLRPERPSHLVSR